MFHEIPVRCYGISVVILKPDKENLQILLLKRNHTLQGEWCQIAGKIKNGEKAWQGALRELKEETGLTPIKLYSADICEQFYEIDKDSIWIAPVFVAYVSESSIVKLNHEHSDFGWFAVNEAIEKLPFAGQRKVLRHVDEEFIQKTPIKWLEINFQ